MNAADNFKNSSKDYHLESSFWVPAEIDAVWDFGSKPKNLVKISPANLRIEVEHEGAAFEGLEFEIKISPSFLPFGIAWGSRIEQVVAAGDARHFVDVQTRGPFLRWQHTHKFVKGVRDVESSAGATVRSLNPGTWISDSVDYALPFGVLGSVAHGVVIHRLLQNMFRDRKAALLKLFA